MENRAYIIYKLYWPDNLLAGCYIGQHAASYDRFSAHVTKLKSNSHHCEKLQDVYNVLNKLPVYEILESVIGSDTALNKEKEYITKLSDTVLNGKIGRSEISVNSRKIAYSVVLTPDQSNILRLKYGSLTKAILTLIP